jgi:secretion/DNA translocation related TadE-like protein
VLSASVLTAVVASAAVLVGQTELAGHRAAAAADLAALAAADSALLGPAEACARAAAVAAGSGARLVSCTVVDGVSDVSTGARLPVALRRFGTATARARAGPPAAAGAGGEQAGGVTDPPGGPDGAPLDGYLRNSPRPGAACSPDAVGRAPVVPSWG